MDPAVAEAFAASTSVSCKCPFCLCAPSLSNLFVFLAGVVSKGIGAQLLKVGSKRRRTTKEILAEKESKQKEAEELEARLAEAAKIHEANRHLQTQLEKAAGAQNILQELIAKGVIQQDDQGLIQVPSPRQANFNI